MEKKPSKPYRSGSTTRYWTTHWQYRFWRLNEENAPITSSGSNNYSKRGVAIGDIVYVVSIADGQLYLGGRMTVGKIVSRSQAVRIRQNPDLFDVAEWIIPKDRTSTLLQLHRRLAPEVSKQLLFVSPRSEPKQLFFERGTDRIDRQATRGVRELTPASARLLDHIIEITDKTLGSGFGQLTPVAESLLRSGQARINPPTMRSREG